MSLPLFRLLAVGLAGSLFLSFGLLCFLNDPSDGAKGRSDAETERSALAPPSRGGDDRASVFLLAAVLSAREHSERRTSIRRTWTAGLPAEIKETVRVEFVVGNQACSVPPELRVDPLSCEVQVYRSDGPAFTAVGGRLQARSSKDKDFTRTIDRPEPLGVDFEFSEDAAITHLGVYDEKGDGLNGRITAYIYDSVSGKLIVKETFNTGEAEELLRRDGFVYKAVQTFGFPKGFIGSAVAENFSKEDPAIDNMGSGTNSDLAMEQDAVMHLLPRSRRGGHLGTLPPMVESVFERAPRYLAASFLYTRHPAAPPPLQGAERAELEAKYRHHCDLVEDRLLHEQQSQHDIATVPLVDTYRNLPKKLLVYFENVVKRVHFSYLLKTDDDCAVNLHAIVNRLSVVGRLANLWWGRFRREWQVERYGKWRELHYSGRVYPPFACGSGNVLSADLIAWLAMSATHLHTYQGEDVSLGVWLAAVGARQWDDERWFCSLGTYHASGNSSDFLSVPNLSPADMIQVWQRRRTIELQPSQTVHGRRHE